MVPLFLTLNFSFLIIHYGAANGARTHDLRIHSPAF